MKIAVIQFPGSNCESESLYAVQQAGMEGIEFLWNAPREKLADFDGYFIVGGFSYEDRSRSGIIASLDPLMANLKKEAEKGKPILGVCNGAQILVESGLVPGLKDYKLGMALAVNKRMQGEKILGVGFYNAWIHIACSVPSEKSAFTRHLKPGEFFRLPVAHGEGRFLMPVEILAEVKERNLGTFRYCDEQGNISEEFPVNPNGATYNLAAVSNSAGNIMAIMPHPERTPNGQPLFTSMRDYIAEQKKQSISSLSFKAKEEAPGKYAPRENAEQLLIHSIITDNEAITVQSTLQQMGIDCTVTKQTHWEIDFKNQGNNAPLLKKIYDSGELFNNNKEMVQDPSTLPDQENTASFLVRYQDDFVGQSKKNVLATQCGIDDILEVKKGLVWHISVKDGKQLDKVVEQVLDTHILFNPYSQVCYQY